MLFISQHYYSLGHQEIEPGGVGQWRQAVEKLQSFFVVHCGFLSECRREAKI